MHPDDPYARQPEPFQRCIRFVSGYPGPGTVPGWSQNTPIEEHPYAASARTVSEVMRGVLRDELGRITLGELEARNPHLFDDLEASVQRAWEDGHHAMWLQNGVAEGNRAMAQTGAILGSLLRMKPGETAAHAAVRSLAAVSGIDPADEETLVDRLQAESA